MFMVLVLLILSGIRGRGFRTLEHSFVIDLNVFRSIPRSSSYDNCLFPLSVRYAEMKKCELEEKRSCV